MEYSIPLTRPYLPNYVKQKVLEVLESGYLTEGLVTRQFEQKIRDWTRSSQAISVPNCTLGLELALRAFKIGPGDEVIIPDYTYPATAAAVAMVGAVPVLVDISLNDFLIDYHEIEKALTPKTKAILPVSLFGNPLDYSTLNAVKKKHNLLIIEDAACALGSSYHDEPTGSLADVSVFSFHPRKFITTGEGGMITTQNSVCAAWMDSYKRFGMKVETSREQVVFDMIGTNYKLSNLQAALGLAQLEEIEMLLKRRRALVDRYLKLLSTNPQIKLPKVTSGGEHSWQTFCIQIPSRDKVMKRLRGQGIEVQIGSYALHLQPAFSKNPQVKIFGSMKNSKVVDAQALALPLYHQMSEQEQDRVVQALFEAL